MVGAAVSGLAAAFPAGHMPAKAGAETRAAADAASAAAKRILSFMR